LILGIPLLCLATARAQQPAPPPATTTTPNLIDQSTNTTTSAAADTVSGTPDSGPPHLSNWITYTRPDCCGPVGGDGPITYDLYLRTGSVFPVGGNFMSRILDPGWEVDGGGRTLFYNVPMDAAWLVDIGISYMYNHTGEPNQTFTFEGDPTHVAVLDRTWFSAGLGYEWYLRGNKNSPDLKWKAGVDAGGRWGMARIDAYDNITDQYFRLSDTIGAAYVGAHTDVEIPCGCCTFEAGVRLEYDYTWMDIIPNNSDVQDINFMITLGVRF